MKTLNVGILCALLVLTASSVFTQKARPRTRTKTTSTATKKTATTTKKTELPTPAKPEPVKTGKIDLEAGLIFNSGDIKPVGRTTFYLLKDDAEKIILTQPLLDLYNQDRAKYGRSESLSTWSMFGAVLYMNGQITPNFASAAKTALESATAGSTTTGFDGKATFDNVPVGDYYIFGYYKVGKNTTYWNIPITVKPGDNKVILDNENMKG